MGTDAGLNNTMMSKIEERSDIDIATNIMEVLCRVSFLATETLRIKVKDGWIILDGTASWNYQRSTIEDYVRKIEGVRGVSNYIILT